MACAVGADSVGAEGGVLSDGIRALEVSVDGVGALWWVHMTLVMIESIQGAWHPRELVQMAIDRVGAEDGGSSEGS
jgi:hypothetical protein